MYIWDISDVKSVGHKKNLFFVLQRDNKIFWAWYFLINWGLYHNFGGNLSVRLHAATMVNWTQIQFYDFQIQNMEDA